MTLGVFFAGLGVLLIASTLLAVSTWSKRRLLEPLSALLTPSELSTSWLDSSSEVHGFWGSFEIWIEITATTRGVLKISIRGGYSAGLEVLRESWLRSVLGRLAVQGAERLTVDGCGYALRWDEGWAAADQESVRSKLCRLLSRIQRLDRVQLLSDRIVAYRVGYRKSDLAPEEVNDFLRDFSKLAVNRSGFPGDPST